ncbi:hypothetical protein [Phnomibacter sp. MR]|uniref:hypothetical protein n=1 Tax=Phnomibacter sp. MR TaxID=3042318 RepID=UPI003A807CCF
MNTFDLEIWDDEGEKCTFYTVRKEGASLTETDKFFLRYENESHEYNWHANLLLRMVLHGIGNKHGATDDFFDRYENHAQALPPKPKKWIPEIKEIGTDFPLRLYCLRISESIVVLFNGGMKQAPTAQASSDLSFVFREVQTIAQRITNGLLDGTVSITTDDRYLIDCFGQTDKISL